MKNKIENKLLLVGPDITHGIGGVTIHVQRLRNFLEKRNVVSQFIDYKNDTFWKLLRGISKSRIIHFHISNPVYQFILILCSRLLGKKIIMTLHGNYGRYNMVKNWMVRSSIRLATIPIVINENSFEACKCINNNLQFIPAFIPPQKDECLQPEIITLFNRLHDKGKLIVSTNASNVSFDKNGNDIYGIGFLVNYFEKSDKYALVVSDPSGNYNKKYANCNSKSVFFITYPHSYYELLKYVDYFVRNTSTDGDALSVKESLYLGVPTLCSDVVDRPRGVVTFKYSDKSTFERCLQSAKKSDSPIEDGTNKLLELYMKK